MGKLNCQNNSPEIKVEVEEEESNISKTQPKVISFQNSISESLARTNSSSKPVTESTSASGSQSPSTLNTDAQFKLANLSSLKVQVKPTIPNARPNLDQGINPELFFNPSALISKQSKDLPKRKTYGKSMDEKKRIENQNIVTLFPTDIEESSDGSGVNLTKTYRISKQQIDKFRNISRSVVKNEMSAKEAGKLSGLDEEIVKTWIDSLEDILATNQEAVEKARKYEEMKKHLGSLNKKMAELQNMVQLSAVVRRSRRQSR